MNPDTRKANYSEPQAEGDHHRKVNWSSLTAFYLSAVSLFLLTGLAEAVPNNADWVLHDCQLNEGLPNNNITGVTQTPDGYLWVGTRGGLVRFDGMQFEDIATANYVSAVRVRPGARALLSDHRGGLWMAMDPSVVVHLHSEIVDLYTNPVPNLTGVDSMAVDGEGTCWVAYHAGTVSRVKNGMLTEVTARDGLPAGNGGASFAVDTNGGLWFVKNRKMGIFRDGKLKTLQQLSSTNTVLATASNGAVWVCADQKLFQYREGGELQEIAKLKFARKTAHPSVILEDHKGALWIGTSDSGLYHFDGSAIEQVQTTDRQIQNLTEDGKGNLWVGTGGGGLDKIRPRVIRLEGAESGLPFEVVQSLCEDTNGVIWAATENGLLVRRTKEGWSTVPSTADFPIGLINCVVTDKAGTLWIGSRDGVLYSWRDGKLDSWPVGDGSGTQSILVLYASRSGDIWMLTGNPVGLERFRDGRFQDFQLPSIVRSPRTIAEDASGNIWVGTGRSPSGRSILRVTGDKVFDETSQLSTLPGASRLVQSYVRCMLETKDGSVWSCGGGGGVVRIKNGKFSEVAKTQGMLDEVISQMVEDDHGWIWFGSDHGIFKVRQQELDDAAEGRLARVQSERYGADEDLHSVQGNNGSLPGSLRSHDGRLWIPLRNALAVVDTSRIREDTNPPPILIKSVLVDGRVVASYGGIVPVRQGVDLWKPGAVLQIPPGHRRLDIEFTTLSFNAPEKDQFRYRLEGYDEGWTEAGVQRSATYSRLSAGDYHFHVMGCNSDGIWNEAGSSLTFTVVPFWWQMWWFRLAVIAIFSSALFAIARYISVRHLRSQMAELEHQAALDKSRLAGMSEVATSVLHNVGNALNSVNVSASLVSEQVRNSRLGSLSKVVNLLKEHERDLPSFLANDPNGKQLPEYLKRLNEYWKDEQEDIVDQMTALKQDVDRIAEIVARQQAYTHAPEMAESFDLVPLVEDAIRINATALEHAHVQVAREYAKTLPIVSDRHKVLQILINLISNTKHAFTDSNAAKKITVRIEKNPNETVKISIADNGKGIAPENLSKIFRQDFKRNDPGVGLHKGANTARELGGSLVCRSDGAGQGATFTLEIPIRSSARLQGGRAPAPRIFKKKSRALTGIENDWSEQTENVSKQGTPERNNADTKEKAHLE